MKKISAIVPVYNEDSNIAVIAKEIIKYIGKKYDYEIIFIDDGSTDKSLSMIEALSKRNSKIKFLSFSRNFGHQVALKAGIDYSNSDCVIMIDADLQHPPQYIKQMLDKWEQGYDVVNSKRIGKHNIPALKNLTSKLFYALINSLSDVNILQGGADFRLIDKKVVKVIQSLNESTYFLRGLIPWSGFKSTVISYEIGKRHSGETKYSIRKMLAFALDGVTSLSVRPLRIATFIGFFFAFVSGLYGIYAIVVRLLYNQAIVGWASLVASVVFMGGVQLLILGIIGEYLGKLFIQAKNRPLYIVKRANIDK